MSVGWLLDVSAYAVGHRPAANRVLHLMLTSGLVHTCAITELQALATVGQHDDYRELRAQRLLVHPRQADLTDAVAHRALDLQAMLAQHRHHAAATPAQLLVAATAAQHDLIVLHHAPAFAVLHRVCGLAHHPVIPLEDT